MEPLGKCTGDTLGKWFDIKLQLEDRKWRVMSDNISAEKYVQWNIEIKFCSEN